MMRLIFFLFLLVQSSLALAQEVWVHAGGVLSTLRTSGDYNVAIVDDDYHLKPGYCFGLSGNFKMNYSHTIIQSGFSLISAGGIYHPYEDIRKTLIHPDDPLFGPRFAAVDLIYIKVPVLAMFMVNESLYFNLGPYAGFLIDYENEYVKNMKTNSVDYGVIVGSSVYFAKRFGTSLYYQFGLGKVETVKIKGIGQGSNHNSLIELQLSYKLF
ncbi:MAG: outer membrane beta-barrel protein [Cyclobacteriaceae bacterium]